MRGFRAVEAALQRRTLLRAGLVTAGAGLLGACARDEGVPPDEATWHTPGAAEFVTPDGEQVQAAEAQRNPGPVREFRLTAAAGEVDLGGLIVPTWSYDGQIPGPPIRVTAGEVVRATLANQLPTESTIHWHGLALRNDADGVPHVTQPPIRPGEEFTYEFTAPHPGTYWFHPHTSVDLDRGLYAVLIVDDPEETLDYDDEWTVVLDDWLDGVDGTPEDVLAELEAGAHHGGHGDDGGEPFGNSPLLGADAGDVRYPHFLLNGRLPTAPETFQSAPGRRLRLRLVNAGGDTAFRVALGGHAMTVTHTDGFPVEPVETDALLLGMGERYDVLVTLADGVFPLVALAEGKGDVALGLVRTGGGAAPGPEVRPSELDGHVVGYDELVAAEPVRFDDRPPDRTIRMELTGGNLGYRWGVNGLQLDHADHLAHAYPIEAGERVQLDVVNTTHMWHPIHLHGHTFALGPGGPRKDTANVLREGLLSLEFQADNPGLWLFHCHNIYHAETGMGAMLGYLR